LAITLARTMESLGQFPVNHIKVTDLVKDKRNVVCGVTACDQISGTTYTLKAKAVVNAAGIFVDNIRRMDKPDARKLIAPSQGVHLILDKAFDPGETAIMVPHTDDGRVIFMVPWHGRVIVGTTDTPIKESVMEPKPLEEEVEFLLSHAGRYLSKIPKREDVLSIFTGIRPLISGENEEGKTSSLSRDHHLTISPNGLVTIAGGKWTTYRKMGEDTIDKAAQLAGLPDQASQTRDLRLHGWCIGSDLKDPLHVYGSYAGEVRELANEFPELAGPLHPKLPYLGIEVVWAVRHEWAHTLGDMLSRRTRSLLLNAAASVEIAPRVAAIMATELQRDQAWIDAQVAEFKKLAQNYMI
ncbi:MAG: glycerol-3-phosphate dehydrogenase/oxidase, partial [Desulfobacterales bacterium]|nr:glycerol-3-phosphate dehydrogenase/oxidase [Desulfobacterales bacterium]